MPDFNDRSKQLKMGVLFEIEWEMQTAKTFETLYWLSKGMQWSKEYDTKIKALSNEIKKELEAIAMVK